MASTRNSKKSQAANAKRAVENPKTFKERDAWICAMLGADLPPAVRVIGALIGHALRVNAGECKPGYTNVAAQARVCVRSIVRAVAALEHTDFLAIERKDGCQNSFVLTVPTSDKPKSPVTKLSHRRQSSVTPTSDKAESPLPVTHGVTHKERSKRAKKESGKKDSLPPRHCVDSKEEAAEEKTLFPENTESKPQAPRKKKSGLVTGAVADAFAQFWAAYPRHVAKEAARKAFDAAVKSGVAPEVLIEGAKRYAGERAGQDPKFTKHPATWLRGGCWEDEPPPRADGGPPTIDGRTGEVIAPRPRRDRDHEETWDEIIAKAAKGPREVFP